MPLEGLVRVLPHRLQSPSPATVTTAAQAAPRQGWQAGSPAHHLLHGAAHVQGRPSPGSTSESQKCAGSIVQVSLNLDNQNHLSQYQKIYNV